MANYTVYHLHSDLSNGTTNIDSVTKFGQYVDRAKELGMMALGFSEHGNIFEWYHKKMAIEKAGMKYIHACECYVTEQIADKVRDNYHCVLIARNFEGFKELNSLMQGAFNRHDGHFYYVPRITFDQLIHTSDNIIITTACLGGILHNGGEELKERFLQFLTANKHRCFLEIQHHDVAEQKEYNIKLADLSRQYGIPLIAGTDTHALNDEHLEARHMLQIGKGVNFAEEEFWDLRFKSYDELVKAYAIQGVLAKDTYLAAIANTNTMASMVEPFELDHGTKYPKIYENSYETFKQQINAAYKKHPYIKKRYPKAEILEQVNTELDTYDKTGCIDFMLLQTYLRNWEQEHGIYCGYGRGSVSGSLIAYILGVTNMDSKKFNLNFFRFLTPSRVTNADIDTDYASIDRDRVKSFILDDHMNLDNIQAAEIITFNTIKTKGAIKDIGRALSYPLSLTQEISNAIVDDKIPPALRAKYPELFKYVDIVSGVIVSVGTHPSGVLVSDLNIDEMIGTCTTKESPYPVSMLNMKELDALMYVKLDLLGLDNVGLINETCRLAGIERLTPDNTDLNDEAVWRAIREDTTMIFQWESQSAQAYLRRFMSNETLAVAREKSPNFSWIKWFSFGNGLLRPGCASYRDEVARGEFAENGLQELDDFLAPTMGHVTMQEDIMQFLVKFCGYSQAESDIVRRAIAKKYGTEQLLPEIAERFTQHTHQQYNVPVEQCRQIIQPFIQVIQDASSYAFSWNHSDSYSCIGYICGYLRHYYPYEFVTAALNIFEDNAEKTVNIIKYAQRHNIAIDGIKFRYSRSEYQYDKESQTIYKGMNSIKFINKRISDELYKLGEQQYGDFFDLLIAIRDTSVNSRQLEILIQLNFFSEFGEINELLERVTMFEMFYGKKQFTYAQIEALGLTEAMLIQLGATKTEKQVRGIDTLAMLRLLCSKREFPPTTIIQKIGYESKHLGYINIKLPDVPADYAYIIKVDEKYTNKLVTLYRLKTGEIETYKVKAAQFKNLPIQPETIIRTIEGGSERKWRKDNEGKWYQIDDTEMLLYKWCNVKC